jgi:pimeloyl-ACP methyl ester carboxylesterase
MIQANVPTWVLIHGMNSKPNVFFELGTALDGLAEGDQVLFVDWERAAKSLKLSNTKWIIPAAEKLVPLLNQIGVTRSYLDVVGHSWGTYMAYEIGKQIGGGDAINRLVALDPALKGEGYDFERIDFGAVSSSSLAFRSDGVFGNADIPKTADHSIVVGTKPVSKTLNLGVVLVGHSAVRDVYTSIINSNRMGKVPDQISVKLSPNKMASDPGWQADRFAPAGMAMGGGGYEAVLLAPNKKTPSCLYYYNSSGEVESLPKANSGGGGESFGEF